MYFKEERSKVTENNRRRRFGFDSPRISHISPQKCMMCGVNACSEEMPLCCECVSYMQEAITDRCVVCNKTARNCSCADGDVQHAFFYDSYFSKHIIRMSKMYIDIMAADFICELAINCCAVAMGSFDGVAFVPRHRYNMRLYGYDQAECFAWCISKKYEIPIVRALERIGGREQKLLSHAERIRNIRHKYRIRNDFERATRFRKILLIDDIYTTGATMRVCSELLRGNISKAVIPLTLSKTNHLTGSRK